MCKGQDAYRLVTYASAESGKSESKESERSHWLEILPVIRVGVGVTVCRPHVVPTSTVSQMVVDTSTRQPCII